MYNHQPKNYRCPFCAIVQGEEGDFPYTKQADVFYIDDQLIAIIASHWWPNNKGHVIIITKKHYENLYDLPDELGGEVQKLSKKIAIALKETYHCDGVSVRQHNEEAGGQDVWHYHYHVIPRYSGDKLYVNDPLRELTQPEERVIYAHKLRQYFKENLKS